MIKKIFGILLIFTVVVGCAYADNTGTYTETAEQQIIYTLTLEEAIDMAMTDNPQLIACNAKKEDTAIQLKAQKETKSQYSELTSIPISTSYELVYIKNGYYVHTYEKSLELVDYEYRQIEAEIAYKVTEKYYNVKNCEKLVEIAQNSYNLVQNNYDNAKLSYELGLISKADLDSANVGLMQAKFTVDSYKNNLDIAVEDFKIALRKNNENCDFVLTSQIAVEDFETNLTEDLFNAENSRYDIKALKVNCDLAKEYLDLTLDAFVSKNSAAQYSYITAEYNYTNNKSLILLGIKSSYNNIAATKNNVSLAEATLNLKKNAYNIAKVQFDQGLITNTELLSSLNDVNTSEIEYENSRLKYKLAVDKYKYDISIGL